MTMGVALIGALYGRTSSDVDDQDCQDLAARFLNHFKERFGSLQCGELRESGYGSEDGEPCSKLAERGVRVLMEVVEQYRQTGVV